MKIKSTMPALSRRISSMRQITTTMCLCLFLLGLSSTNLKSQTSVSYNWGSVAMGGGGFVSAIITSKTERNLMYARTDVGGAYRWDAASNKWVSLLDWASENETGYLGVESIASDPQEPNKVYMLVGISYFNGGKTAILRSSDYGKTFAITDVTSQFKAHGNGMGRQTGEKLVVDPNSGNILFSGSRSNGLFKSANSGASWTNVSSLNVTTTPNGNGISLVVFDPLSSPKGSPTKTIFVGISRTGTNLYRSNDGGQTFSVISGGPTNLMPQRAVLASDRNLYITYANGAGPHGSGSLPEPMDVGQIWKYNTLSGTWTNITPSSMTRAFAGISVDPNNPMRLVASTVNTYWYQDNAYGDRIFLSTNGGSSWTDVVARGFDLDPNGNSWVDGHAIHWAGSVEFDPFDTKKAWITSGNGIFSTDDIDATLNVWKFRAQGVEETVPLDLVSIPNGPLISAIGDYDGFRHTNVTQYAPINTPRTGTTSGMAYAALNTNIVLRVGSSMYYSTNMGVSWTQCSINGTKGKVAISADGNVFLHSPESSTTTYRSTNRGASWSTVSGLSISGAKLIADPVNSNKFYAYNNSGGAVMISTDGGASFSTASTISGGGSKNIQVVPGKEGHLWIALYGGGLTRSTNSGQSFTKISTVSSCGAVGIGKEAPGSAYPTIYIWGNVGGVTGVYRSINEGATWTRVNDDEHEYGGPGNGQFVVGDMNVYGRVYMSTAGRGIAYGEPSTATNSLTVSSASLSFTSAAGSQTVSVSSNVSWTATDDQSWITLSSIGGSNNGSFTVSANANTTTTARTATITVAGGGISRTIIVTQAASSGCAPTAITPYLQVNNGAWQQASTVSVAQGNSVRFGPQPISETWTWTGPNGFTATTREINLTNIQASATYTARYTNPSGCVSTQTFTIAVTGAGRLAPAEGLDAAIVVSFPNPVEDKLTIRFSKEMIGGSLLLTNTTGKVFIKGQIRETDYTIDMGQMASGLYLLKVNNKTKITLTKILKK